MTTLDNGIVIGESFNAVNFTPAHLVPSVFGHERIVEGVDVHHWGNDGQDFNDVLNFLKSNNSRQNSAHFVLQADRVECIVNTDDSAWASGHPYANAKNISIECRPEMTDGDLETLASLIRYLETVYGSLIVYGHNMWQNTACPGRYGPRLDWLVGEINNVETAPAPVTVPASAPYKECCCA